MLVRQKIKKKWDITAMGPPLNGLSEFRGRYFWFCG
jgi:hypothetical protein